MKERKLRIKADKHNVQNPEEKLQIKSQFNPFMPNVPTFAVRETSVSRTANVGTMGMNGLKAGRDKNRKRIKRNVI